MSKIKNGGIPEGWEEYSLGNIAKFKNGKSSPERNDASLYDVFGSNGVIGRSAQYNSSEETVIVGRVGSYCGSVYFSKDKCWITDNAIIGSPSENVDARFLYYLLLNLDLNNHRGGSGQPLLNQGILNSINVLAPIYDEQRAIAKILSDLDAKIELNYQMNKILEQIARAIFKQWFVDFKFPGYEKTKFVDGLPNGWQLCTIADVAEVIGGGTPSTQKQSYYCSSGAGIAWISPRDLSGYPYKFISRGANDITEDGLKNSSARIMPENTILMSSRAPIGYLAIAANKITTNQGFKSLIPKKIISLDYLFYWLKQNVEYIESISSGSTFKEVSGSVMKGLPLMMPSDDVLSKFDHVMSSINSKIKSIIHETENLTQIRDSLLPRLMSGKIRVN